MAATPDLLLFYSVCRSVPPLPLTHDTHGPEVTMRLRTRSKPRSPRFKHSPENSTRRPWKFSCSKTTNWRREAPMPKGGGQSEEGGVPPNWRGSRSKRASSLYINKSRLCTDRMRACHEPKSVKLPCHSFSSFLNLISAPLLGTDGSLYQAFICAVPSAWNALYTTHPHLGAHVLCPFLDSDITSSGKPSLMPFT